MEELLDRIISGTFKPSSYTIYNKLDDDGYIDELEGMFGVRYGVDDFEKFEFTLSTKENNGISYRMSSILGGFEKLKEYIENDLQDDRLKPKAKVYIIKGTPTCHDKKDSRVFIVKLKEFDLTDRIKHNKNGENAKA